MVRWKYFRNQEYLSISLLVSFMLHMIVLFLLFIPNNFLRSAQNILQIENSKERSLIRLHSEKEEEDNLNQFVSPIRKKSVGKITISPPGIHVLGEGKSNLGAGSVFSSKKMSGKDLLKKIEKESPRYVTSFLEETKNIKNDLVDTEFSQEGMQAFSQNSKEYQFFTTEIGDPQIGADRHEWAEFYLGYSESCSKSLKNLFRLMPLVGTDQIVFVTKVFKDGTIKFVNYLQQSHHHPVLNDIGKQMIKYSKKIEKFPTWNFAFLKDSVQVVVKLAYSQQTGIWTISFYGEHD